MFVTFVCDKDRVGAKYRFNFLKTSVRMMLEHKAGESHIWTMRRPASQMTLIWNWCFKLLMFLSKFLACPFGSILCQSTSVGISFLRTCERLTICWPAVLLFPILKSWRSKYRLCHEGSFQSRDSFSIWCAYSTTILVIRTACILPGQSLVIVDFFKFSKDFDLEERTAKWPAVIGKDACQKSKSSIRKRNLQS